MSKGGKKFSNFAEHISEEQAQRQIEEGTLFYGVLRINPKSRKMGFVTISGICRDVCILDEVLHRNRAMNGDHVAVELLPESEWREHKSQSSETHELGNGESDQEEELIQRSLWQPKDVSSVFHGIADDTLDLKPPDLTSPQHQVNVVIQTSNLQPAGKIVAILDEKHKRTHVGELVLNIAPQPGKRLPESVSFVMFHPQDRAYPYIKVPRINLPEAFVKDPFTQCKKIFSADILTPWPFNSQSPLGGNVRSIGEAGTILAETEALLIGRDINHGLFSEESLQPLRELLGVGSEASSMSSDLDWEIPADEIARRRDLRAERIFTIDPPTAKDLDDALHITPLEDGTFSIGVHIADVSYFLTEGTELDMEAQHRATSIYLVQKVIPMLPPILCEQLCSLNPNVDRLAFSCIWRMNADGTLVDEEPWYGRTVIRSCAKLDYPTAQRMIDGIIPAEPSAGVDPDAFLQDIPEEVWEHRRRPVGHAAWACARDVRFMHSIAASRRKFRLEHGALVLNRPKLTFQLDADGNPSGVQTYLIKESNQLVEEYMLLANYLVAQKLLGGVNKAAFLRNHGSPNKGKMGELQALADKIGLPIDVTSAKTIQESLARITAMDNEILTMSVTALLTQPFKAAQYLPAGAAKHAHDLRHFALSIPYYTHFTSPIRRYADVTVHRLLDMALRDPVGADAYGATKANVEALGRIAEQCNEMKKASREAQERSSVVYLAVYLDKRREPLDADAVVIGIGEKSFTVLVTSLCVEKRLYIDDFEGVSASFDEGANEIVLTAGSTAAGAMWSFRELRVGLLSRVRVRLSAMKTAPIDVRFSLLGPAMESGDVLEGTGPGSLPGGSTVGGKAGGGAGSAGGSHGRAPAALYSDAVLDTLNFAALSLEEEEMGSAVPRPPEQGIDAPAASRMIGAALGVRMNAPQPPSSASVEEEK